jgi:hypothetical protein
MASNTTLLDPIHFSGDHSLIPAIPYRRKHRNSTIVVALRRRGNHKKHSGINSPVNFIRQGFVKNEVSARKLAAGLWQLRFVEVSGNGGDVIIDGSFRSSNSKVCVCLNVKFFFSLINLTMVLICEFVIKWY